MSNIPNDLPAGRPEDEPPVVRPVRADRPYYPPPPPRRGGLGRVFLLLVLLGSLALNVVLFLMLLFGNLDTGDEPGPSISERFYSGSESARDKIAVVKVEGLIAEGLLGYDYKQIDRAAKDKHVKAVVLRVDSPGGTVTASDDLHRRLTELKLGKHPRYPGTPKPLVAHFGSLAASGGYYIAMPAEHIVCERSGLTGSIGVYAQFINVEELAKKYGVESEMIRRGDVKGSGSLFKKMTPEEREPWERMVDQAYRQFISVVEEGRPQLKGKMTDPIPAHTVGEFPRKRADGGVFTAADALKFGLIDEVGYLDRAVAAAAQKAGLTDYKVVVYDRPTSLLSLFGGSSGRQSSPDLTRLARGLGPRLWFLAPQSELAGLFAGAE